jgi:hypothetical protein
MTCQVNLKVRSLDYGVRGGFNHASGLAAFYGTRMEAKQRAFLRSAKAFIPGKN